MAYGLARGVAGDIWGVPGGNGASAFGKAAALF